MLVWHFYHASYVGNSALSGNRLDKYSTTISNVATNVSDNVVSKAGHWIGKLHLTCLISDCAAYAHEFRGSRIRSG